MTMAGPAYPTTTEPSASPSGTAHTGRSQPRTPAPGHQIAIDGDGKTHIAYFEEEQDDLVFTLAGHDEPVVMGSSLHHPAGTSLGSGVDGLTSMDLGQTHGCAIKEGDGGLSQLMCWGDGSEGQLGVPPSTPDYPIVLDPASVPSIGAEFTPTDVSVSTTSGTGGGTTCALYRNIAPSGQSSASFGDIRVICWGAGGDGQLGSGAFTSTTGPSQASIVDLDSSNELGGSEPRTSSPYDVVEISLSENHRHGCARSEQGLVKCWGHNGYGQLGLGNATHMGDDPNEMGSNLPFVQLGPIAPPPKGSGEYILRPPGRRVQGWYNGYGQLGSATPLR